MSTYGVTATELEDVASTIKTKFNISSSTKFAFPTDYRQAIQNGTSGHTPNIGVQTPGLPLVNLTKKDSAIVFDRDEAVLEEWLSSFPSDTEIFQIKYNKTGTKVAIILKQELWDFTGEWIPGGIVIYDTTTRPCVDITRDVLGQLDWGEPGQNLYDDVFYNYGPADVPTERPIGCGWDHNDGLIIHAVTTDNNWTDTCNYGTTLFYCNNQGQATNIAYKSPATDYGTTTVAPGYIPYFFEYVECYYPTSYSGNTSFDCIIAGGKIGSGKALIICFSECNFASQGHFTTAWNAASMWLGGGYPYAAAVKTFNGNAVGAHPDVWFALGLGKAATRSNSATTSSNMLRIFRLGPNTSTKVGNSSVYGFSEYLTASGYWPDVNQPTIAQDWKIPTIYSISWNDDAQVLALGHNCYKRSGNSPDVVTTIYKLTWGTNTLSDGYTATVPTRISTGINLQPIEDITGNRSGDVSGTTPSSYSGLVSFRPRRGPFQGNYTSKALFLVTQVTNVSGTSAASAFSRAQDHLDVFNINYSDTTPSGTIVKRITLDKSQQGVIEKDAKIGWNSDIVDANHELDWAGSECIISVGGTVWDTESGEYLSDIGLFSWPGGYPNILKASNNLNSYYSLFKRNTSGALYNNCDIACGVVNTTKSQYALDVINNWINQVGWEEYPMVFDTISFTDNSYNYITATITSINDNGDITFITASSINLHTTPIFKGYKVWLYQNSKSYWGSNSDTPIYYKYAQLGDILSYSGNTLYCKTSEGATNWQLTFYPKSGYNGAILGIGNVSGGNNVKMIGDMITVYTTAT